MSIKTNFEIALNKFNEFVKEDILNEGNIGYYQTMGQSSNLQDKQKMFDAINKDYFKGKSPFSKRLTLKKIDNSTMQEVYKVLREDIDAANKLFNLKRTGIGSGEIMMAYIVENLTIGGGSADVDLNLFDPKSGKILTQGIAELKEVTLTNDGFLTGWRTGARHASIRAAAIADIRTLYLAVRDMIPELDPTTTAGKAAESSAAKGELSTIVAYFKDLKEIPASTDKDFKLSQGIDGDILVKFQGEQIGSLKDKKTLDSIQSILQQTVNTSIKTFDEIEKEVAKGFGSIDEKFVFIRTTGKSGNKKIQGIYYKEKLPNNNKDLKIAQVTQNTIKVKVRA